jgi:GAF domain-containing protein
VLADAEYTLGDVQRIGGYRAALGVPLLREGNVEGAIFLARTVPQPFTSKQIELAQRARRREAALRHGQAGSEPHALALAPGHVRGSVNS